MTPPFYFKQNLYVAGAFIVRAAGVMHTAGSDDAGLYASLNIAATISELYRRFIIGFFKPATKMRYIRKPAFQRNAGNRSGCVD